MLFFYHSRWIIGNEEDINFWNDAWLPQSLYSLLNLLDSIRDNLGVVVKDFVVDNNWVLLPLIVHCFT